VRNQKPTTCIPVQKKIVISRDVIFEEGQTWNWNLNSEETPNVLDWGEDETDIEESDAESDTMTMVSSTDNLESSPEPERQSRREKRTLSWLQDYDSVEGLSEEEQEAGMILFMSNVDPKNYVEAMKDAKWIEAMKNEINSIKKNKTWELVTLPAHAKKIGVKWIYKTKLNEEGKVDKCKARLVAKGYTQTKGINYNEVFALVARWDTIWILLAVTAQEGWIVYQLDVKSAFLYGELKEEVYVDQPEGFIKQGEEDKVY